MVFLNVVMVTLTLGLKTLRSVKEKRVAAKMRGFETALDESLVSGELHPDLRGLEGRDLDLLAISTVEYLSVLSGEQKDRLAALAGEAGLVERYRRMLASRGRWRKARAAENLGYLGGPETVPQLSGLLSHPDETVRAVAARALARISTPEAARALAETLNDPSELTRLRMAENLERIGSFAVDPLVGVLEGGGPQARVLAARVLGNLRAAGARPALGSVLRGEAPTDVRAQAALALGKVGDPEDVPALLDASGDEGWPVRAQVANALAMIGDLSSIPALQKLTVDREWWVRLNASRALANMGPAGERALARILEGEDRYARERAAATLGERGIVRRVVGELAAPGEKGEGARALVRGLVRAGATRHLEGLARTMPDGPERDTLAGILGRERAPAGGEAS